MQKRIIINTVVVVRHSNKNLRIVFTDLKINCKNCEKLFHRSNIQSTEIQNKRT